MAGLPIYEGSPSQMLGDHPTAESMGKELDHARPTPDHAVGATPPLLEVFDRIFPGDFRAASVKSVDRESLEQPLQSTPIPDVYIRYV